MKKNLHSIYYYIETTQTPVLKFNSVHNSWQKLWLFWWQWGGEKYISLFFIFIWWKNFESKCFHIHGQCSKRENEFAPKMCISATMIIVVNFSDGLQTRKFSPPYFLQLLQQFLNGFCKFLFSLTDIKRYGINNKTFRYREKSFCPYSI